MRFATNRPDSKILAEGLAYKPKGRNRRLCNLLLEEQQNFCAYTERYAEPDHCMEIEHFDDTIKGTSEDTYDNWFAAYRRVNLRKPGLRDFGKPVCNPAEVTPDRYIYRDHEFHPADENDVELKNLIEFLRLNEQEFVEAREQHVDLVLDLLNISNLPPDEFDTFICRRPKLLSYLSALEATLGRHFEITASR